MAVPSSSSSSFSSIDKTEKNCPFGASKRKAMVTWHRFSSALSEWVVNTFLRPADGFRKNLYLWGYTGTGKTRFIYDLRDQFKIHLFYDHDHASDSYNMGGVRRRGLTLVDDLTDVSEISVLCECFPVAVTTNKPPPHWIIANPDWVVCKVPKDVHFILEVFPSVNIYVYTLMSCHGNSGKYRGEGPPLTKAIFDATLKKHIEQASISSDNDLEEIDKQVESSPSSQ